MSIFEIKQGLFSRGAKSEKTPLPKEEPKEVKKDTSAFGEKSFLKPDETRQWLRNDPNAYKITGISNPEERAKLEKKWFEGKYAQRDRAEKVITKLRGEKNREPIRTEKAKIDKEIKLLEKFLGK